MKTIKTSKKSHTIPPALVQGYRDNPQSIFDDQIEALRAFLTHRGLFASLGNTDMVAATERAWWQDAVLLASMPTASAEEASRKISALRPAFDGHDWQTSPEGHRGSLAMMTVAIEAERRRWQLDAPARH